MRKLIVLALMLVGGVAVYAKFFQSSESFETYKQFAEALAYEDVDTALALTTTGGEARANLLMQKARRKFGFGGTYSITGISYELESETKSDDTVELILTQVVRVGGGGSESALGRPVPWRHVAELRRSGDRWKVEKFERDRVETD